jgi:hypothetical protein
MQRPIRAKYGFFDYFCEVAGKTVFYRLHANMNRIMRNCIAAKKLLKSRQILPITRGRMLRPPLSKREGGVAKKAIFSKMVIDEIVSFRYSSLRATPPSSTAPKNQSGHEEYENSVALSANPSLGFLGLLADCIRPA